MLGAARAGADGETGGWAIVSASFAPGSLILLLENMLMRLPPFVLFVLFEAKPTGEPIACRSADAGCCASSDSAYITYESLGRVPFADLVQIFIALLFGRSALL